MTAAPRDGVGAAPRLLVVAGAVLWGTTGTAQALAPAGATPATVGAVRLAVGAATLVAITWTAGLLRDAGGLLRPGVRGAALAAAIAMAAYQVAFFGGVARAGVAVGTVVALASAPAFTGLLAWVVRRELLEPRWWPATALAVAGAALLVTAGAGGGGPGPAGTGVALALGAGAAYAAYTVASKVVLQAGFSPATTVTVTFAAASLLLLPALVGGDASWVLTGPGAAVALWLGIATVAAGYVLFATGLRQLRAASVATLTLAEPLTAGTLGVVLLGERTDATGLAGVALLVAGLALLVARRRGAPVR